MPHARHASSSHPIPSRARSTAPEVCAALARGLARAIPGVDDARAADGRRRRRHARRGARGGRRVRRSAIARDVRGAAGDAWSRGVRPDRAADGLTAVIEVAQVVGITDAAGMAMPVEDRSTRGVGELVAALLDRGRAPLHDRAGRQQHQRRRQRGARGARRRDCSTTRARAVADAGRPGVARPRRRVGARPAPRRVRDRASCRTSTIR